MGQGIVTRFDRVLVVADDERLAGALTEILEGLGISRVAWSRSAAQALRAVTDGIDAAFLSASTPDSVALRVATEASRACPAPLLVVVTEGPHPDLFALARAGVQALLPWPASPEQVLGALERTFEPSLGIEEVVRLLVGRIGLREAQNLLRRAMLRQAMVASQGSRRAAARVLGVTRPAVQRMLREDLAAADGTFGELRAVSPEGGESPARMDDDGDDCGKLSEAARQTRRADPKGGRLDGVRRLVAR